MNTLIIITKNILKRLLKKPTTSLLMFVVPVIASIGLILILGLSRESLVHIVVTDHDYSRVSFDLIKTFEGNDGYAVTKANEIDAQRMLLDRVANVHVIIPDGLEDSILMNQTPNIQLQAIDYSSSKWVESTVNFYIENITALSKANDYDQAGLYQSINALDHDIVKFIVEKEEDVSKEKAANVQTFGIYMMFLLITTCTISFKILDEKAFGTFGRIGMSPVNPNIYTLANILANCFVMMIQIAMVIGVLNYGLKVDFYTDLYKIFIILMVFAICGIAAGVFLSAVTKDSKTAYVIMGMVLSPSCLIAGCLTPIEFMPKMMLKLAYFTPQRWTLDAIKSVQIDGSLLKVLPHLTVILGFTLLFFLIAVYKFKNEEHVTS